MSIRRQHDAMDWAIQTFGPIANNPTERTMRFLEEAIELAQAMQIDQAAIGRVIERVYSRGCGHHEKEIAQAGLTLELLAQSVGFDAEAGIKQELNRIMSVPKAEWERRHAAKVALGIAS